VAQSTSVVDAGIDRRQRAHVWESSVARSCSASRGWRVDWAELSAVNPFAADAAQRRVSRVCMGSFT